MELRHSFRIMSSRFSLVYKSLLFISIVLLMLSALTFSAVYSVIEPIIQGINNMQFFEHIGDAARSLFAGDLTIQSLAFEQVKMDFSAVSQIFVDNTHNVVLASSLFAVFVFISKALINVARIPTADVLNNFMNSNSRFGFTSNLIVNLKKAIGYSMVDALISIPYYVIMGLILWGIGALFFMFSIWLGIIMILVVSILLFALKHSVLILWLPMYVKEDKGVFKSLKDAVVLNKKNIIRYFGQYIITFFGTYAFTVVFGFVTFGIGAIISLSIFHVLLVAVELVAYYRVKEEKYYIDPDTVVNSKTVVHDKY